jgi:hypothetical protein
MWTGSQYDELEHIMSRLISQPEHGPISMAWMLVNFSGPNGEESFDSYRHFGELALKAGCFVYLEQFLGHKMFKVSFMCYDSLIVSFNHLVKIRLNASAVLTLAYSYHCQIAPSLWNVFHFSLVIIHPFQIFKSPLSIICIFFKQECKNGKKR